MLKIRENLNIWGVRHRHSKHSTWPGASAHIHKVFASFFFLFCFFSFETQMSAFPYQTNRFLCLEALIGLTQYLCFGFSLSFVSKHAADSNPWEADYQPYVLFLSLALWNLSNRLCSIQMSPMFQSLGFWGCLSFECFFPSICSFDSFLLEIWIPALIHLVFPVVSCYFFWYNWICFCFNWWIFKWWVWF